MILNEIKRQNFTFPDLHKHTPKDYEMHKNQMEYVLMLDGMREMI